MEGSVPHHVELQAGPLLPLPHSGPLLGLEIAVHIPRRKHLDGGVCQGLEPPEPANGELGVEVGHQGEDVGVAEVDVGVAAEEGTHAGPGCGVLQGDVLVDLHPSAGVEHTDTALVARVVRNSAYRTLDLPFGQLFWLFLPPLPPLAPQGV